jgi:hypothetical protein
LIGLRRAERDYELARQSVTLDVRNADAQRRTGPHLDGDPAATTSKSTSFRNEQARELFSRGCAAFQPRPGRSPERPCKRSTNQFAAALADYRLAILTLLRDCGTLRIDDDGYWVRETPAMDAAG